MQNHLPTRYNKDFLPYALIQGIFGKDGKRPFGLPLFGAPASKSSMALPRDENPAGAEQSNGPFVIKSDAADLGLLDAILPKVPALPPPVQAPSGAEKITGALEDLLGLDIPFIGPARQPAPKVVKPTPTRAPEPEAPAPSQPSGILDKAKDVIAKGVASFMSLFGDPVPLTDDQNIQVKTADSTSVITAAPNGAAVEVPLAPVTNIELLSAGRPGTLGFFIPAPELREDERAILAAIISRALDHRVAAGDPTGIVDRVRAALASFFPVKKLYKGEDFNAAQVIQEKVLIPLAIRLSERFKIPSALLLAALKTIAKFESSFQLPPETNPGPTKASGIFQYVKTVRANLERQLKISFTPGNLGHELLMAEAYFSDLLSSIERNFDFTTTPPTMRNLPSQVSWDPRSPAQLRDDMQDLLAGVPFPASVPAKKIILMIIGHRAGFNPAVGWTNAKEGIDDRRLLISEIADVRIPSTIWTLTTLVA